jgi:predicted ATP-grasp superfamily ATP-dependent carboligase
VPLARAEDVKYAALAETTLARSLLLLGVSGLGNAASLAARHLVRRLEPELVGAFHGQHFPPAAVARKGLLTGAIRVWGVESPCGPGGECERLLVLENDVPLELGLVGPLSTAVAAWAASNGVSLLLGIDTYSHGATAPDRVLVGASVEGRDAIGSLRAEAIDDAVVTGFNAGVVAAANAARLRALVVYGPRLPGARDDAAAAAAALRAAEPLLPRRSIDAAAIEGDLRELAERLEREAREAPGRPRAPRGYA